MALSSAVVWEVRTAGNANNGGGFVAGAAGTDYSQQDAAQYSGTNLACPDGDAAAPTITSATHNFVAADVGNLIHITAGTGWTAGWYQIVSCAGNAATLDRAVGTNGAKTSGTFIVGGAVATPNTIAGAVVAGNKIWIKNGTYVGQLTITISGNTSNPISWIGYNSSRGDSPTANNTRPILDGNSEVNNPLINTDGIIGNNFHYLQFTGGAGSGVSLTDFGYTGAVVLFSYCRAYNNGNHGFNLNQGLYSKFFACEASGNTGNGFEGGINLFFCYSHDNGESGFNGGKFYFCISDTNTSYGFEGLNPGEYEDSNSVTGCIAYNNGNSGFKISIAGRTIITSYSFMNCISKGNTNYGFESDTAGIVALFDYNCYQGNSVAGLLNITAGAHDVTGDPLFTDPASGDFSLQAASPCKNTGFPGSAMAGAVV